VMESGGNEYSQERALSLRENRNRWRQIALMESMFNFNVSHTSKKIKRWRLGSSIGDPPNSVYWTIETSADYNSKLFTANVGLAMLEVIPWTFGVMKSRSVLLSGFLLGGSISGEVSQALRLCLSTLWFFLFWWKVLSISGSRS